MAKKNMTEKLISVLSSGKEFTPAQLTKKVGLQNVRSTVHRLRAEGYRIYTNTKNTATGKKNFYRLAA